MIKYRMAEARDMDGIIDFINMVFSMLRVPHNFEKMLPKVYAGETRKAEIHLLAEEEERLCGCLAMYEFPLRVGSETLRVGYMGSMAVHPRVRGQGTMGELMRRQTLRGIEMGMDMLVLGGQRQRYERHGYTPAGATITYSVNAANVRHALADVQTEGVLVRPMEARDVPTAFALYSQQAVTGARTQENFLDALVSYENKAYAIEREDTLIGYLVASPDAQRISELVVCDPAWILVTLKAWLQQMGVRLVRVEAAPYDEVLNRTLAPISEAYTIAPNCMLQVVNVPRVLKAYMQLKAQSEPLGDGQFRLGYGERGVFEIRVQQGEVSVEPTQEPADVTLTALEAMHLIFDYNSFGAPKAEAPAGWFPLPFHIPGPDSF